MEHLVKFGFFHEKTEFNYQALCPSPVECVAGSSSVLRSMFGAVFNGLVAGVQSLLSLVLQVNYGVLR